MESPAIKSMSKRDPFHQNLKNRRVSVADQSKSGGPESSIVESEMMPGSVSGALPKGSERS